MSAEKIQPKSVDYYFQNVFKCENAYATTLTGEVIDGKHKSKTIKITEDLTEHHWQRHLASETAITPVPICSDDTCTWGAIDIDNYELKGHWKWYFIDQCKKLDLVPCRSKSGGLHLYSFASEPILADRMVNRLAVARDELRLHPSTEIFPKQTKLNGKIGNGITLPYKNYMHLKDKCKTVALRAWNEGVVELSLDDFIDEARWVAKDKRWYGKFKTKTTKQKKKEPSEEVFSTVAQHDIIQNIKNKVEHPKGGTFDNWVMTLCGKAIAEGTTDDEIDEILEVLDPLWEYAGKSSDGTRQGMTKEKFFEYKLERAKKLSKDNPPIKKSKKVVVDFMTEGLDINAVMLEKLPPLQYAVDLMIPEGLTIVAGRGKSMKSWTFLKMAFHVVNGIPFMKHKVDKGDALYIALEDGKRRIKDRIRKLRFENLVKPFIKNECPYLGQGLEESLKLWIERATNPKLIVIDTLARVKPPSKYKSGTLYDHDSELLRDLQNLATQNQVSIVVITHLNKSKNHEYEFDRITGSTGLQGVADTMWSMDRGVHNEGAYIRGIGRDLPDFDYAISWNEDEWCYEYLGDFDQIKERNRLGNIFEAITTLQQGKPEDEKGKLKEFKLKEILTTMNLESTTREGKAVTKHLQRLKLRGTLQGSHDKYSYKPYELTEKEKMKMKTFEEGGDLK